MMLHDPATIHLTLGCIALFVGTYQLVARWLWSSYFREGDRVALRVWAVCTAVTAYVIGWAMFQFAADGSLGVWFELSAIIVGAQAYSAVSATFALRDWMSERRVRVRAIP